MRNVVIVGNTLVIILVLMMVAVLPVNTVDFTDEQIIKVLPDGNPYQTLYDEMLYPTVKITTAQGIGSGVVIQCSKVQELKGLKEFVYVLTAAHVVENNSSVTVTFYSYFNNQQDILCELCAFVVITDTNKDLALLRFGQPPYSPLTKGDSWGLYYARLAPRNYKPYLFTPVYAVGCSLGLNPRPSSGIISAIHLSGLSVSAVEVTSPILPGNSGGPVFTADTHEIIGIAVWVKVYHGQLVTTMAGIVPITEIHNFLNTYKR